MRFLFLLFIGLSFFIAPAHAAVNITQPLSFGSFALRNNSAVRQMRITAQDVFTSDAAFVTLVRPQRAVVNVSGFPARTNLIVNVTFNNLSSGVGDLFTIDTPTLFPNNLRTNNAGVLTFYVGATLRTSGTGSVYPNNTYSGLMNVSVNF